MIFYFSATGNSRYIAERLAAYTGDRCVHMVDVINSGEHTFAIGDEERVGIVTPTYAWGIPSVVGSFLKVIRFAYRTKPYFYLVATYGTTCGHAGYYANRCLKKHNQVTFDACYSVRMVDTWTPMFNVSGKTRNERIDREVELQLDRLLDRVACRDTGDFMTDKVPAFTRNVYRPYYDRMRETIHFHLEDSCVGCGLCVAQCPTRTLAMRNGRPVWIRDHCAMCLGCLHRCPKFAIQYGNRTIHHGQYTNPHVDGSGMTPNSTGRRSCRKEGGPGEDEHVSSGE